MIKKIVIAIVSFMICTNGVSTERVQVEINADTELYSIQVPQDMLPRMRPLGRVFQNLQELTLTSNNGIKIPSRLTPVIEGYLTTTKIIPDSILHNELVELISEQVGEDFSVNSPYKFTIQHNDQGPLIIVDHKVDHNFRPKLIPRSDNLRCVVTAGVLDCVSFPEFENFSPILQENLVLKENCRRGAFDF
jgi:hypothetical protein